MRTIFLTALIAFTSLAFGQRYITKNGYIRFFSSTPMENIEAHNKQVNCALDIATGDMVFKALIKSFEFEKALMQEHFNENYMESDKYPNASFTGKIQTPDVPFTEPGVYPVEVAGDLTIHGVTRNISEKGTITVENNVIKVNSVFMVKPADYEIKIPKAVINNIAKEIEVTVDMSLEELKK